MTKKLLFITPIFPRNTTEDNVVPFISQFTQKFEKDKDAKIDIITLMYPFSKETYTLGNLTVYALGGNFKKKHKKIPLLSKAILKGIQLCKKNKYDGVLCFWYREAALVGKVLSLFFNLKLLVWLQGQDAKIENSYVHFLRISANNLVMISNKQKKLFNANFNTNVQKVANLAISKSIFPTLNKGHRKIDILGVGNLGALKNYSLFVDIVSELKLKNVRAVICGQGEEFDLLQKKVEQLKLTENIKLLGIVSNQKVLEHMNNTKVFLHTSTFEGGATVIQEALFSGCQVVSTIEIDDNNIENFYYSSNKVDLVEKTKSILLASTEPKRVENFKIKDTINEIYNHFYNA